MKSGGHWNNGISEEELNRGRHKGSSRVRPKDIFRRIHRHFLKRVEALREPVESLCNSMIRANA
jgi:hypothetical protein